jgi:hypothetical protein
MIADIAGASCVGTRARRASRSSVTGAVAARERNPDRRLHRWRLAGRPRWSRGEAAVLGCRDDGQDRLSHHLPDRDDTEVSEAGAVAAAITRVSSGGQAFLRGGWGHVNRLAAVPPPRQVIAIFASLIALWLFTARGAMAGQVRFPLGTIVSAPRR